MFYEIRKKNVLSIGSSVPDAHNILLSKHAEEYAIMEIKKYLSRSNKKLKDIKIIIWKQNKEGCIKPVNCCAWCKKTILKNNLNNNQIVTPLVNEVGEWNGSFRSSIVEHSKKPVLKV